jgi:hypothetical protein
MLGSIPLIGSLFAADVPAASTPQATSTEEQSALSGLGYVARRSAPAPVWLDCELEVSNASALGRFLYAAGDAQLSLGSFTLAKVDGERRIVRFAVNQGALPDLAIVAHSTEGAQVISLRLSTGRKSGQVPSGAVGVPFDKVGQLVTRRDLPKATVEPVALPAVRGCITKVDQRHGTLVVTINRGRVDGVRRGTTFEIHAESKYKGRVEVVTVHEHECTAIATMAVRPGSMGTGDSVATFLSTVFLGF